MFYLKGYLIFLGPYMVVFNNIKLSFYHKGHQINGTLNGDLVNWEFKSHDEVFRNYFPNGVLVPKISFTKTHLEYDLFLNDFYYVADRLINIYK